MVAPPSLFDNFKSYFSAELNKQISTKGNIDPDFQNSDSDSDWLINNYANFFKSDVNQKGTQASINKISEIQKYGTTRHIKEIFLGRCYEYQYKNGVLEENEWNCENLWKLFFKAFGFKKPCDVTSADYKELLDNIDERIPRDKALLWSGTRELAHKYSDFLYTKRFTTLEDTLAGYLLNGLTWCGSDQPPGINFNQCPWECSIQAPYWSLANQRFAQKLSGIIHIVLNGTRQHYTDKKLYPAYMKHRYYLGPYMIPEFNKRNISMVVIIVAHTLHLKPIESCGQKTVQMLADDIKAKDIPVVCYDDPRLRSNPFASFVIHAEFPSNPNQYLPNISEHKIQNEPDSLIDDPSSIFFDPNEKPGFVYTSTASYTNNFDYKQYIPGPENTNTIDEKRLSKVADKSLQENSVSSEYDDSLDTTQSLPNTPSVKSETGIFQKQFSNRNNVLCAENLESDRIYCNSFEEDFTEAIEFHSALKGIDHRNSIPDPSLVDDYSELHLYEDELLYNCDFRNKGYNSESESVKTYQDSGIYDDDVFLESPKPMTSEELESVTEQLFARENGISESKKRGMDLERFSAFKTPNSSRHNSLELIVTPQSPKMPSFKKPAEMNSGKRSSNKYSHIQAKVQCHRREERSVSPGIPLRKKSPTQAKPPSIKTALCKPTQKPPKLNEIKPKVDSLSNINYVPGGGESKVFTERLTFRQKAEPRTDTHGIEMYAHLPEEFQEIARRLARQDSQLKKQNRGRSASRSHSSSFAVSSRQSSVSPERGRSRTRRTSRKLTPGNSISDIFAKVNSNKQLGSPVKPTRPSLSRSSSIRSIPNTPNLYKQHPASAIRSEKSPTASPARSPGRTTESKTLLLNYNEQLNTLKNRNKVSTVAKADRMPSPVMKLYQFTTQNDSFGSLISN